MANKAKQKMNHKEQKKSQKQINLENLQAGIGIVQAHSFFSSPFYRIAIKREHLGKAILCITNSKGEILVNEDYALPPGQWAFAIAHSLLHHAFGHFDAELMPGFTVYENDKKIKKADCNIELWNMACDIYINRFLQDIKFGQSPFSDSTGICPIGGADENTIYQYLAEQSISPGINEFGTAAIGTMDMKGLENPIYYGENDYNWYKAAFSSSLVSAVRLAVRKASNDDECTYYRSSGVENAANWFLNHYPLLGGVAAHFKLIEDGNYCIRNDIHIAAIDVTKGELYVNPNCRYSEEEWKFVLAHEYLHAGLDHQGRCNGRDHYLWNIACDFVINGWLHEMQIGAMPDDGLLYDESLKGLSAESVYDQILENARKYEKLNTLRGFHKGDFISFPVSGKPTHNGQTLDEFCKNALSQGLEYQQAKGRGYIPAGLIEEIRALCMPPIPWDVSLAKWFDIHFEPLRKQRTYAKPSRRQASTPNIPRPSYYMQDIPVDSRTFGVVVDTSGSMEPKQIGKALGSIASYADAHDVPYARVVFCDAIAYDAGYLSVDEIAGNVKVIGRGGTVLQPGVNLLEDAKDFPKDGPILIITDGEIEDKLIIKHEHAFLIPRGSRFPFRAKCPVFYFD